MFIPLSKQNITAFASINHTATPQQVEDEVKTPMESTFEIDSDNKTVYIDVLIQMMSSVGGGFYDSNANNVEVVESEPQVGENDSNRIVEEVLETQDDMQEIELEELNIVDEIIEIEHDIQEDNQQNNNDIDSSDIQESEIEYIKKYEYIDLKHLISNSKRDIC